MQDQLTLLTNSSLAFLLIFFIFRRAGFFLLPDSREQENPEMGLRELIFSFSIYLLMQSLVVPLFFIVFYDEMNADNEGVVVILSLAISSASLFMYCFFARNIHLKGKLYYQLPFGALSIILAYPAMMMINLVVLMGLEFLYGPDLPELDQLVLEFLKGLLSTPHLFKAAIFLVVFVVPIAEEVLFRGCLQSWLRRSFSPVVSIAITSILFGLIHFSSTQGYMNVQILISLMFLGGVLGYLYERQGSLYAPIGLHMTFNAIGVTALIYGI